METPYRLEISLKNKENEFKLPSISYGIYNNNGKLECYIYSILNKKNIAKTEEENKYIKKISRLLYKLNNGVMDSENEEYKAYKELRDNYYPENISDVSVSSVLSLSIFINILKNKKINKIYGITYLPVRYLGRKITSDKIENKNRKEELEQRNNSIQKNLTDKFIRTFRRISYHMEGVDIINIDNLDNGILEININTIKNKINNELLEDINNHISR